MSVCQLHGNDYVINILWFQLEVRHVTFFFVLNGKMNCNSPIVLCHFKIYGDVGVAVFSESLGGRGVSASGPRPRSNKFRLSSQEE